MDTATSRGGLLRLLALTLGASFLFCFLFLAHVGTGPAAAAVTVTDSSAPVNTAVAPSPGLLLAGYLDRFFQYFEGLLNNRRNMLQFGLVMMVLGLWIIWWKKK